MKLIITGSLGHISKPLTEGLVQKGHLVTVISSKQEKQKEIQALRATVAIGSLEDVDFLTSTFSGADAVYCMEPPVSLYDRSINIIEHYEKLGNNYAQAIQKSGVKRVVNLSSIGAHTNKGIGMLACYYSIENMLKQLPPDIAITFLRPVGFYHNLYAFINMIKTSGSILSNYYAEYKEPWVSPIDIAAAASEELERAFTGRKIRYVASDEVTTNQLISILGSAIRQPDLTWNVIPDKQLLNDLITMGMSSQAAKGLVEMNASRRDAVLYEDYYRHRPTMGKIKMADFAKEFANAFKEPNN